MSSNVRVKRHRFLKNIQQKNVTTISKETDFLNISVRKLDKTECNNVPIINNCNEKIGDASQSRVDNFAQNCKYDKSDKLKKI